MGSPDTTENFHVLVIDDEIDEADSLKDVIELAGYRVEVAYSGMEGIERARLTRPDVIVCDLGLPDIDGLEIARLVRVDPDIKHSFLVALTGYTSPHDVEQTAAAGYDQHMAKPADPNQLTRLVALRHDARH